MNLSGVSIVVCCHNSAERLPPTLMHLARQQVLSQIPWEVIIIDNASTDDTANVGYQYWPGNIPAPLKVFQEPTVGLSFARQRGFLEAQYEFISFVDDDNWVAPNWVETVYNILMQHPEAGACGGQTEAVCEVEPPDWFERHKSKYAIGKQAEKSDDVTWSRGYLWGAGLTIRKTAWESMVSQGFQPMLTGRLGNRLSAGDDSEICLALRLAGWKLWYDEQLFLKHYLPANRLRWDYLKRLVHGFGASSVFISLYHLALVWDLKNIRGKTGKIWIWRLRSGIARLIELEISRLLKHFPEGDDRELEREWAKGSVEEILRLRGMFDSYVYALHSAKWNISRIQNG